MFDHLHKPKVEVLNGVLVKRAGLLYRKKIRLSNVKRVIATSKDAITHEETVVCFFDSVGMRVWISEYDVNFANVIKEISNLLPGFSFPADIVGQAPFAKAQRTLWSDELGGGGD